jgi:hypothetical protein
MAEASPQLLAGVHYPRTLREFNEWFPDEAACLDDYLARLRWTDGFLCPACGACASLLVTGPRFSVQLL